MTPRLSWWRRVLAWLDSVPCRLMRHPNAMRVCREGRMMLVCPDCHYESPGWDLHTPKGRAA